MQAVISCSVGGCGCLPELKFKKHGIYIQCRNPKCGNRVRVEKYTLESIQDAKDRWNNKNEAKYNAKTKKADLRRRTRENIEKRC